MQSDEWPMCAEIALQNRQTKLREGWGLGDQEISIRQLSNFCPTYKSIGSKKKHLFFIFWSHKADKLQAT